MKANIIKFGESLRSVPPDHYQRTLHDLRIPVMDRRNFRCRNCMPEEQFHNGFKFLRRRENLSFDKIIRITQEFRRLGEELEMQHIGG